uniref:Glutathione peroxidase 9 n=1 Tax=Pygocentrus nattereri TaxID=42514 RepID=A0A3B4CXB1_PYGNA
MTNQNDSTYFNREIVQLNCSSRFSEENHETLDALRCVRPGGGFIPKFPMFSKIEVNGMNEEPLYAYLKESLPSTNPIIGDIKKFYWSPIKVNDIRWNFEKFLITADGVPYKRALYILQIDGQCAIEGSIQHIFEKGPIQHQKGFFYCKSLKL